MSRYAPQRRLSTAFLALFLAVICSVGTAKALSLSGATDKLPEWLGLGKQESLLEGRSYHGLPTLNGDTVLDGSFQLSFESFLSDAVPARDDLLLANAALQRKAIEASNALFRFPAYPTFYGSDFAYVPEADAVICLHDVATSPDALALPKFAEAVNGFAANLSETHPDARVALCNPEAVWLSERDPLYPLTAGGLDHRFVQENLLDRLSPEVTVIDAGLDEDSSFSQDYFRTDHHWNIFGAYKGYLKAMEVLLPEADPVQVQGTVTYDEVPFFGSRSRAALMETQTPDHIADILYDESPLEVRFDGEPQEMEALRHRQLYEAGSYSAERYENRYGEYFHDDPQLIEIDNPEADTDRTLVIVADSYTNCVERLFAEHYAKVYAMDLRKGEQTLSERLEGIDADDVLFLMTESQYTLPEVIANIA